MTTRRYKGDTEDTKELPLRETE